MKILVTVVFADITQYGLKGTVFKTELLEVDSLENASVEIDAWVKEKSKEFGKYFGDSYSTGVISVTHSFPPAL